MRTTASCQSVRRYTLHQAFRWVCVPYPTPPRLIVHNKALPPYGSHYPTTLDLRRSARNEFNIHCFHNWQTINYRKGVLKLRYAYTTYLTHSIRFNFSLVERSLSNFNSSLVKLVATRSQIETRTITNHGKLWKLRRVTTNDTGVRCPNPKCATRCGLRELINESGRRIPFWQHQMTC